MMKPDEVRDHLSLLGLTPVEAAQLLGVGLRTVRRWTTPDREGDAEPIPGAAEAALRAWLKLHRLGLAWQPDARSLVTNDAASIDAHRAHAVELESLLTRVRQRRGPATLWDVDVERGRATLGKMVVTFYRLQNGGFSPQSYARSDGLPIDLQRDQTLLEDAYACIAMKLAAESAPPRVAFAFEEPELSLAWDDVVEMWDMSLSPSVVVTIPCAALREAVGLVGLDDDDLPRFVRKNKAAFTALAEGMFARDRYSDVRIDAQLAPVFRRIEIGVADLLPLASKLRRIVSSAAIARHDGSTL